MGIEKDTYMKEHIQYEFPRLMNVEIAGALTNYGLGLYEHTKKHTILYGRKENVEEFALNYLGYDELEEERTIKY